MIQYLFFVLKKSLFGLQPKTFSWQVWDDEWIQSSRLWLRTPTNEGKKMGRRSFASLGFFCSLTFAWSLEEEEGEETPKGPHFSSSSPHHVCAHKSTTKKTTTTTMMIYPRFRAVSFATDIFSQLPFLPFFLSAYHVCVCVWIFLSDGGKIEEEKFPCEAQVMFWCGTVYLMFFNLPATQNTQKIGTGSFQIKLGNITKVAVFL